MHSHTHTHTHTNTQTQTHTHTHIHTRARTHTHRYFPEEALSCSIHPSGMHLLVGFSDKLRLLNILMDDIRPYHEFNVRPPTHTSTSHRVPSTLGPTLPTPSRTPSPFSSRSHLVNTLMDDIHPYHEFNVCHIVPSAFGPTQLNHAPHLPPLPTDTCLSFHPSLSYRAISVRPNTTQPCTSSPSSSH
jgi:hypothetical protein